MSDTGSPSDVSAPERSSSETSPSDVRSESPPTATYEQLQAALAELSLEQRGVVPDFYLSRIVHATPTELPSLWHEIVTDARELR